MIRTPFAVALPASVSEALEMLDAAGSGARVLAGGQSLVVDLKAGLTGVTTVVDLSGVDELVGVIRDGDVVRIGAMTRHADVERSSLLVTSVPLLAHAASAVADPQVRHLGTIGGSLCHGDPAADLPAALTALRATVESRSADGVRAEGIDAFVARRAGGGPTDDIVTAVVVPVTGDAPWAFQKFRRRAMMWATVGVSVVGGAMPGIGLAGMAATTSRAAAAELAWAEGRSEDEVAGLADHGCSPRADAAASPEFRRHLARVLLRRALAGESTR